MRKEFYIAIILMILSIGCIGNDNESIEKGEDNPAKPKIQFDSEYPNLVYSNKDDVNVEIWEVHPDFVRITSAEFGPYRDWSEIKTRGKATYPGYRPVNVIIDPNLPYKREYKTITYRGNEYEYIYFTIYLASHFHGSSSFYYRVSMDFNERPPYVHGEKGGERLISIGNDPGTSRFTRKIVVVAIPSLSENLDIFDFEPYKLVEKDDWKLFYYDITNIVKHESIHISFKQTDHDPEDIQISNVFPNLKSIF